MSNSTKTGAAPLALQQPDIPQAINYHRLLPGCGPVADGLLAAWFARFARACRRSLAAVAVAAGAAGCGGAQLPKGCGEQDFALQAAACVAQIRAAAPADRQAAADACAGAISTKEDACHTKVTP